VGDPIDGAADPEADVGLVGLGDSDADTGAGELTWSVVAWLEVGATGT
jgi:hypothetical protein